MNNKLKKQYFELHPELDTLHFTDEFAFYDLGAAKEHAARKAEGEPQTLTRNEAMALPDDSGSAPSEDGGNTTDISKWTNAQLMAECDAKGIAYDPKATKAVLVALLTPQ